MRKGNASTISPVGSILDSLQRSSQEWRLSDRDSRGRSRYRAPPVNGWPEEALARCNQSHGRTRPEADACGSKAPLPPESGTVSMSQAWLLPKEGSDETRA